MAQPASPHGGPVLVKWIASPVGKIVIGATENGLCLLEFDDKPSLPSELATLQKRLGLRVEEGTNSHLSLVEDELARYFEGQLREFTVPLVFGGTEFQQQVWRSLCKIPYGETISYLELAESVGSPKAVRAVGQANGRNRISIVVPCHRVINSGGGLGGYGGGLTRKQRLLDLERSNQPLGGLFAAQV